MLAFIAWFNTTFAGFSTAKLLFFTPLSLLFENESLCLKDGGIKYYFLEGWLSYMYIFNLVSHKSAVLGCELCIW